MFVEAFTPAIAETAGVLGALGTAVESASVGAAFPTLSTLPPAPEPASVLTVALHLAHAAEYQSFAAVGAVLHSQFVLTMGTAAGSYAASEAFNALAML